MTTEALRKQFERIVKAEPYEWSVERNPLKPEWRDQYYAYEVQCAWELFQAGHAAAAAETAEVGEPSDV